MATDALPEATSGPPVTGAMDTTQWTRTAAQTSSRSLAASPSSAVTRARTAAAAKAKARAAAASKALTAKNAAARKAAVGAIDLNASTMTSYTPPAPEPTPKVRTAAAPRAKQSPTPKSSPAASVERDEPQQGSSGRWVRPLATGNYTYTSAYGYRWGRMHLGNDFAVPTGTTLRAMGDARVVAAGFYGGMGMRVQLRFDNGVEAIYAHMSRSSVSAGQRVQAGQRIGYSGNTGNSTGPHLHLEIHVGGRAINPHGWLLARGLI